MEDLKSYGPGKTVAENLEMARRAANLGDISHTVLHAQEAVCQSMETLTREIAALRRALDSHSPGVGRAVREGAALAD